MVSCVYSSFHKHGGINWSFEELNSFGVLTMQCIQQQRVQFFKKKLKSLVLYVICHTKSYARDKVDFKILPRLCIALFIRYIKRWMVKWHYKIKPMASNSKH